MSSSADVLFVTLDSCRYDTLSWQAIKQIGFLIFHQLLLFIKLFLHLILHMVRMLPFGWVFTQVVGCEIPFLTRRQVNYSASNFLVTTDLLMGASPLEGSNILKVLSVLDTTLLVLVRSIGLTLIRQPENSRGLFIILFPRRYLEFNSQLDWITDQLSFFA